MTNKTGVLAEVFPAAQLRQWGLPFQGYTKAEAGHVRAAILQRLHERIQIDSTHEKIALNCADALDALIAVFGAVAVAQKAAMAFNSTDEEGYISVAP